MYVLSIDRHPQKLLIMSLTILTISCFDQIKKGSEVFILGDFNVDIAKKNSLCSLVNELCRKRSLTQHVQSPTRVTENSSSTIDLALSNS